MMMRWGGGGGFHCLLPFGGGFASRFDLVD